MKDFFTKILLLFVCMLSFGYADENPLFNPQTQEEALFLRRIAEFWQDEEFEIAKYQIENYISEHPKSDMIDSLYAILGNIHMNEKSYSKAVAAFENIKDEDVKDKIGVNLLASLYHLKWHLRLIDECDYYITRVDGELKDKITYLRAISLYNRSLEIEDQNEINALIVESKDGFEALVDTKFENQAREYLSQIHKTLNDFEKASDCYMHLANSDPTKKDEYLFSAALLQAHFDKERALQTFNEITKGTSLKSKDAAYNKLLLLYEMKRFSDISLEKDTLLNLIEKDKKSLAYFFIGRSFFKQKDYENSLFHLEKALSFDLESQETKLSHIMLMQSAFHLNDFDVFNRSFDEFVLNYPNDEKLFESLFAKAMLNKNNEKYDESLKIFENIISQDFDEAKYLENFLFEYANLLFLTNNTKKSKDTFKELITISENKDLIKTSLQYIVNASIKDLQNETSESKLVLIRQTLVNEIESLLETEELFEKDEISEFNFTLAKTHFDLENFEDSLTILQTLLEEDKKSYFSNDNLSEINLLIGFCIRNTTNDLDEFIRFANVSLDLSNDSKHKFITYINLFNSHLELAKKDDVIDDEQLEKAAFNLFNAFSIAKSKINKNNLIWLSDFLSNKVSSYISEYYKNTLFANKKMVAYSKNASIIYTELLNSEDTENVEEFSIKLAYLYTLQDNLDDAASLLEKLIHNYRFYPENPFKAPEQAIFELAKIYEKQNLKEKAISLYEEFIQIFKKENRFKSQSLLHLSRLWLSNVAKEDFVVSNKELEKIISTLKTVSFQKIFENEPTHLEAALDYVDVVCYMENNECYEKRLFLLGRLKENFTSTEDVISQDYQAMREVLKDKEKIYSAYMLEVAAEKNIYLGFLENDQKRIDKARLQLTRLQENELICTKYLEDRVNEHLKLIEEYPFEEK
ncbi:MAG: hypothetical protein KR126chlam4_00509 [Candidatus Anoxychlamydiales bacterium]|nr:hypothetical protein [Candidatus Anoxychlamydiales bacterium]NGX40681.1 hypothetical protein [Candidatus Anoxychlamydiales bacterium]